MNEVKMNEVKISIVATNETRNAAFAVINRDIVQPFAIEVKKSIEKWGYFEGEEILVIGADDEKCKNIKIVDINGLEITDEERHNYFVIVEGQHRTFAVGLFNYENIENPEKQITVPATLAKLRENETFSERVDTINRNKLLWGTPDYVRSAANLKPENDLLQFYTKNIKTKTNPDGFPISVLNWMCTASKDSLSKKDFSDLCSGKKIKGRDKRNIIPSHDIGKAELFIETCLKAGFEISHINKRYIIQHFRELEFKLGSHSEAIKVLAKFDKNDVQYVKKGSTLDEDKLREKFEEVKNRYLSSLETVAESEIA